MTYCSPRVSVAEAPRLGADDGADYERDGRECDHRPSAPETKVAVISHRACRTWQVTQLDWIIIAFASLLALMGFRQGFIVGVLSFGGFALGAFLGTRLGPLLLPKGSASPYAPAFGLVGALVAGAILASGLEGLGFRLRRTLIVPGHGAPRRPARRGPRHGPRPWHRLDPRGRRGADAGSGVPARGHPALGDPPRLNEVLPPSGAVLNALARLDPLPTLTGPARRCRLARAEGRPHARCAGASRSVVRVLGTACGLAIEGSGWVDRPRHRRDQRPRRRRRGRHDASRSRAGRPACPPSRSPSTPPTTSPCCGSPNSAFPRCTLVSEPQSGTAGAILGYPENGPFAAVPARIGHTQTVLTQNAYGQGPVSRLLTPLRGLVRPGNSGGPVVDSQGRGPDDRLRLDRGLQAARAATGSPTKRSRSCSAGPAPPAARSRPRAARRASGRGPGGSRARAPATLTAMSKTLVDRREALRRAGPRTRAEGPLQEGGGLRSRAPTT